MIEDNSFNTADTIVNQTASGSMTENNVQPVVLSGDKKKKTIILVIFVILILVIAGGVLYYFNQKENIPSQSNDPAVISSVPLTITLPAKFLALSAIERDQLDRRGCVIMNDRAPGFLCLRLDPAGGGVAFSLLLMKTEAKIAPVQDQFLRVLANGINSGTGNTKLSEEYTDFMGYKALVMMTKKESKGITKIYKTLAFIRNGNVYQFDFVASEQAFSDIWPDIELAIKKATFND